MLEIAYLERVLWGLSFFLNAGLVSLLAYRRTYRAFPFFSIYAATALLQNIVLFVTYSAWGFSSPPSVRLAWGVQGLISLMRAAAVAEICYSVLAKLTGIWRLAWRLLVGAVALVALYTGAVARGSWQFAILNLDRSLELAMATAIVLLFVFSRYYEVIVPQTIRTLAAGFFLYSAVRVLDDSFLEIWLHAYAPLWNLLGTVTFSATLLVWIWALRLIPQATMPDPNLLPGDQYGSLSPAVNARLKALNEQLGHFWRAKGEKT